MGNGRPLVIDAADLAKGRGRLEKAWWQRCTIEEFREDIERMTREEQESLISEVNAAVAATGHTANDTTLDEGWRLRAKKALGHLSQRRSILAAAIRARNAQAYLDQGRERDQIVTEVRAMALEGDVRGALLRLLDWVETFGAERRKRLASQTDGRRPRTDERAKGV